MPRPNSRRPLATLFQLSLKGDRISCAVYRRRERLELRLENGACVLLAEPFEIQPRMLARVDALRQSLKRRGWEES